MSFMAALDPREPTAQLLGCVIEGKGSARMNQPAHLVVDGLGIDVHVVDRAKTSQTRLKFPRSCFVNYVVRDEEGLEYEDGGDPFELSVEIAALVDGLCLLGGTLNDDRAVTVTYDTADATIKLTLEEHGVFTSCDLIALDVDADLETARDMKRAFRSRPIAVDLICPSAVLQDLVADLDDPRVSLVRLSVSPSKPYFRLAAAAGYGSVQIDAPKTLFVKFKCPRPRAFTYRKDAFLRGMKALPFAADTSLAINDDGLLRLQHVVSAKANDADSVFLEFTCVDARTDIEFASAHDPPSCAAAYENTSPRPPAPAPAPAPSDDDDDLFSATAAPVIGRRTRPTAQRDDATRGRPNKLPRPENENGGGPAPVPPRHDVISPEY